MVVVTAFLMGGALIKQSNSHKRAVLDYLRKVHFKPLVNL